MVQETDVPKWAHISRRVHDSSLTLDNFVTRRVASLFDLLVEKRKQMVRENVLKKNLWSVDEPFVALADQSRKVAVVNVTGEGARALTQQLNPEITEDEEYNQFCLSVLVEHRTRLQETPNKASLMKS